MNKQYGIELNHYRKDDLNSSQLKVFKSKEIRDNVFILTYNEIKTLDYPKYLILTECETIIKFNHSNKWTTTIIKVEFDIIEEIKSLY